LDRRPRICCEQSPTAAQLLRKSMREFIFGMVFTLCTRAYMHVCGERIPRDECMICTEEPRFESQHMFFMGILLVSMFGQHNICEDLRACLRHMLCK
jgi:hypothetical protein